MNKKKIKRVARDDGMQLPEFARRLGVSIATARRICKKREITYRIIKTRYIVKYADYKEYQDKQLFVAIKKGVRTNGKKNTNK